MSHRWILRPHPEGDGSDLLQKPQPEKSGQVTAPVKRADQASLAAPAGKYVGRRWGMERIFFVDEQVIMTFLGRLLATGVRESLLRSKAIGDFREEINKARMPADLNISLLAVCLLEATEGLIPEVGKDPEPYLDQPTWLEGTVTGVEAVHSQGQAVADHSNSTVPTSLGLRLRSNDGVGILLRLNNAASQGWGRSDLRKTRVQAIGLLCRPRYRHVTAAAVAQLDSVGTIPKA
jgi:hypothetical protein